MNYYEQKIEARRTRYEELAYNNSKKAKSLYEEGHRALSFIPFGQPILVGHHSERADRSYRSKALNKIGRSFETADKAEYYEEKAKSVGTHGISSDDPEAVKKLKEKLDKLEKQREAYKAYNKKMRAEGGEQMASYHLSNLGANIMTVRKRIERLEKQSNMEARPDVIGKGFILKENKELNRLQFVFEGKPAEEVRTVLKRGGFRWSPTNQAWQAFLTNRSHYQAKEIITNHLQ